nr:DNA-processing protein DprA [Morganella morganii]
MILPLSSPHYPFLLKQIYSPPLVLFVAGQYEVLSAPQVSMVGSRAVTHYGEKWGGLFYPASCAAQSGDNQRPGCGRGRMLP